MKRLFLFFVCLVSVVPLFADRVTVSVSDFSVETDSARYVHIGKGISRLVAQEIRKSGNVRLVEREQMNLILEEQRLVLSGLAEDTRQIQLGRLLAAEYIVHGDIIDMGELFMISVRLFSVSTGEVIWEDILMEKLERFDYIGSYFALGVLGELAFTPDSTTVVKLEEREEKRPEAIISVSRGIDALDRGEQAAARRELREARRLDPVNEVAAFYLSLLQAVSPKFRVESSTHGATYNPATLGFLGTDRVHLWSSSPLKFPHPDASEFGRPIVGNYSIGDQIGTVKAGYSFPLGDRAGAGFEVFSLGYDVGLFPEVDGEEEVKQWFNCYGGAVSAGFVLREQIGIGGTVMAGTAIDQSDGNREQNEIREGFFWSVTGGMLFRSREENLTADIGITWTSHEFFYLDIGEKEPKVGQFPLSIDASITYGPWREKLFFGLKGITDLFLDDRGGHMLRIIPMSEYWVIPVLSVRGGYEYSHLSQLGNFAHGHGGVLGLTLRMGKWSLNGNLTYRKKPPVFYPGVLIDDLTLLVGVEYEPGLLSRQ